MRDIEDLFKNSLKDHELPYNASAWTKMSKKLDAKNSGSNGALKWSIGIAGIVLIAASYFFTQKEPISDKVQTAVIINKDENQTTENLEEKKVQIVDVVPDKSTSKKNEPKIEDSRLTEAKTVNPIHETNIDEKVTNLKPPVYREVSTLNINPEKTNSPLKFDKPRDHCLGEKLTYTNLNNKSIYILSPSEELEEIGSSDNITHPLLETGRYEIGILNKDQTFAGSESFNVTVAKQLQINADDYLSYESGLPVLNLQAFTEKEVQWSVNGKKIQENGNSNSCVLFDKGNYNIKASYKDGNGCQSTDEISFFVEKNYNLLAVNAFTPNSSDHRNNTFMPFALTKRDVAFNMIIIDPTNGAVIFKSSNAGQPWKGINKNTGDLVEENKPFVWKVVLQNPEIGERPEYMGTVVRL